MQIAYLQEQTELLFANSIDRILKRFINTEQIPQLQYFNPGKTTHTKMLNHLFNINIEFIYKKGKSKSVFIDQLKQFFMN
ncbi:hypothetical protein BAE31_11815 [Bacillus sp. I-2]|nr:hypothetical protein BAE31_11815 [Bacillus sp. I-2]